MKKGLFLFIDKQSYLIKKEEFRLQELREQLKAIEKKIKKFNKEFEEVNSNLDKLSYINDVALSVNYLNYILLQIEILENEKLILLDKIEEQKMKIARLNAEKKAVEKYLKKKEIEKAKQELLQEGRLADEVFNRRFASDGDFAK